LIKIFVKYSAEKYTCRVIYMLKNKHRTRKSSNNWCRKNCKSL